MLVRLFTNLPRHATIFKSAAMTALKGSALDIYRDQGIHLLGVTTVLLHESFQVEKFISTCFVIVKHRFMRSSRRKAKCDFFFLKIRFNENCISELDSYCGIMYLEF